jgi:hypothetical protein
MGELVCETLTIGGAQLAADHLCGANYMDYVQRKELADVSPVGE